MIHISISTKKELEEIKNGRTIIIRGYNSRRLPHSRIFVDDEIYFVEKGAHESNLKATVSFAESLSLLSTNEIDTFFNELSNKITLSNEEITKYKKKCIVVIELKDINEIDSVKIPNYRLTEDWIMNYTLEDIQNR